MLDVVDVDAILKRAKLVDIIRQAVQKLPMELICLDTVILSSGDKTLVLILSRRNPDNAYIPEVALLKNALSSGSVALWSITRKGGKLYVRDVNEKDSEPIPLEVSELDAFIKLLFT